MTKIIEYNDENVRNINHEDNCLTENFSEKSADVSCDDNSKSFKLQPYAVNACDLGTEIVVQDQSAEIIDHESMPDKGPAVKDMKPSDCGMTVEEDKIAPTNDEAKVNETRFSSSIHRSAQHISGKKLLYFLYFKINK